MHSGTEQSFAAWVRSERRSLLAAVGLTTALLLVLLLTLGFAAAEADRNALAVERELAQHVLAERSARLTLLIDASSGRDEVYERVHERFDPDFVAATFGPELHDRRGLDAVHLLGPGDRPLFSMRDGAIDAVPLRPELGPELAALVAALRGAPAGAGPRSAIVATGSGLGIAAAATLRRRSPSLTLPGAERTVLIVYERLDGPELAEIGRAAGLADLRLAPSARQGAAIPLAGAAGERLGWLVWTPDRPGRAILARAFLPLAGATMLFVLLAMAVLRMLRRAAGELSRSEERSRHSAAHDTLTGLPNRRRLQALLHEAIGAGGVAGRPVALLFLDIAGFRAVNDGYGHAVGDMLLQAVARRLETQLGGNEVLARTGGDEFALLSVGAAQPQAAERLAARIAAVLRPPFRILEVDHAIAAAIGIAVAQPGERIDADTLALRADIALQAAQAAGRDQVRLFEPAMHGQLNRRRRLERDLRTAVAEAAIEVVYQPQVDLRSGRIAAVEALARWHHPELGAIPPAEFIAIAEDIGVIAELGRVVLEKACRDASGWWDLRVAVNVSPHQLFHAGLVDTVAAVLGRTRLLPERLELEITESALLDDPVDAGQILRSLRGLGVSLALDDFGTGYSNLGQLHLLPFDRLKVAKPFVAQIGRHGPGETVVRNILGLARGLGLGTVAEGIETAEQRDLLIREGCELAQGFLFGRPMPAAEIDALAAPPPAAIAGRAIGAAADDAARSAALDRPRVAPWMAG